MTPNACFGACCRSGRLALLLGCLQLSLVSCKDERPAPDRALQAATSTVERALRFDSEFEGRRVCRQVFTQAFMEEVSDLEDDKQAIIVCRLTRLSRQVRGRVVDARRSGHRVTARIRVGRSTGTATVLLTASGWRIDAATGRAVTALIGVKEPPRVGAR